MNKLFASSWDPNQISLTVKGFFSLVIPLVSLLLARAGHSLDNAQLVGIEEAITNVIVIGSTALSALMILVGLIRKLYLSFE